MIPRAKICAMTVLLVAVYCSQGWGQALPPVILEIDTDNQVQYNGDVSDLSRMAANPDVTPANAPRNFGLVINLGDIMTVNGQPAKGIMVERLIRLGLAPAPTPGNAIADVTRTQIGDRIFEILKSDGTAIGSIMISQFTGGAPAPGGPLAASGGNLAIVGGTGAFLGARGQAYTGARPDQIGSRQASMAEDPANRRRHGGGRFRYVLHVLPMARPEIAVTAAGPAVTHSSDFAPVTASRPAAVGEILSVFATGLGPTRPGVDPGKPFPASPLAAVNSPVEVLVNGRAAEVLAAVGYPGAVDGYQVNFRIPSETARGTATIQVSAAWIAGPEVRIPVQ